MRKEKLICAYAVGGKTYRVGTIGPCGDIHLLGNCRVFDNWDEADQVARDISKGKYPDISGPGKYINMR